MTLLFSALGVVCALLVSFPAAVPAHHSATGAPAFLGFDLNTYPGDAALPILRETFDFAGYWLSHPPGARENNWLGKRHIMLAEKFGFLLLYTGPQSKELKSSSQAAIRAAGDAGKAAAAAKKEGFSAHAIIFLDIEEGGRLPANYHAYLRAWVDGLAQAEYRSGVYCSGIPVSEEQGATIATADDIRHNLGSREITYFVFNDVCPPAPGCLAAHRSPPVPASGIPYAAIWQFAQSPRRKDRTARCAATYNADGNCYAPGDTAHAWFLDLDSATTADPSNGRAEKE
jgi:hypothetical protein